MKDERLGRREYAAYIRSPEWAAVKARYRASKLPKACVICGEQMVDMHHRTYKRLGRERLTDLIPLCRKHHDGLHAAHRDAGRADGGHRSVWHVGRAYIKRERRLSA